MLVFAYLTIGLFHERSLEGVDGVVPHWARRSGGDVAHRTHGLLGDLTTLLVAIHIAAALGHHFLPRDSVLARIIPGVGAQR